MTSIITRAAFTITSAWSRHQQKRMEREALLTIIHRKNDHLRRDVGLVTGSSLVRPQSDEPEWATGDRASAAVMMNCMR